MTDFKFFELMKEKDALQRQINEAMRAFKELSTQKNKEILQIKIQLMEMSKVSKRLLVDKVTEILSSNTNKKWGFVETKDFGTWNYTLMGEMSTLDRINIGYFIDKSLQFRPEYISTGFMRDAHYSASQLISTVWDGNAIILYFDDYMMGNDISLIEYNKNFEDVEGPSGGLRINNKFYIEKYPFLEQTLKEIINVEIKEK